MSYVTEHIATTLKAARESRGLSQRALSKSTGVPQSHISKIENGTVDLRLSSLIALARVLDLEVTLVPRKSVSAVQSIIRSVEQPSAGDAEPDRLAGRELKRLQDTVADVAKTHTSVTELAQLQRQVRELQNLKLAIPQLDPLRDVRKAVEAFRDSTRGIDALRQSLSQLQNLRNALVHAPHLTESEAIRPAYSLDEDDNG